MNKEIEDFADRQRKKGMQNKACLELTFAFFSGKAVSEFEFIRKFNFFMKNGYFDKTNNTAEKIHVKNKLLLFTKN